MQIIGIYLNNGDKKVIKNLQTQTWYPFGNFYNCHKVFFEERNYDVIRKEIALNQKYINKLYSLALSGEHLNISLNVNCIVGKNGTGKTTLLDIYYRIINNFSVKTNSIFFKDEIVFDTIWAPGFDAELYYECDGEIWCIHSQIAKQKGSYPVLLYNKDFKDLFSKTMDNSEIIDFICSSFFYSIGINYSLYSYSGEDKWKNKIFHKNDGYFTPIVLLPYRDSNSIDINNENHLAEERVSILSLLFGKKYEFVKGYIPYEIHYKLKRRKIYIIQLYKKIIQYYKADWNNKKISNKELNKVIEEYFNIISSQWEKKLSIQHKNNDILANGLAYLSYKTIKMCVTYDIYKKYKIFNLLNNIIKNNGSYLYSKYINSLEKIIDELLRNVDHTSLKLRQCFNYFSKRKNSSKAEGIVKAETLMKKYESASYEDIYMDLFPPFFKTEFFYQKVSEKKGTIQLKDMSSGENQMLNSISYIIYHLENLQSIQKTKEKVKYKHVSLVFDEAELYYHPEYQRIFIHNLLNCLNKCNLLDITSINLTIVTHSPFMLSDIPFSNVLSVQNDNSSINLIPKKEKTFSANIYDLLKNQFFLDAPVGCIAEVIFNKIIEDYNKKEPVEEYSKNIDFYNWLIEQIGDEYFKRTMKKMINYLGTTKENEKN